MEQAFDGGEPRAAEAAGFTRPGLMRAWTVLMVGDLVAKGVGVVTLVVISRLLSVRGFGTYSFAVAFGTSFTFFTDLGLDAATTRELVARDPSEEGRVLGSALAVKSVLVAAVGLVSVGGLFFFQASLRLAAGIAAVSMLASIPGTPALLLNARIRVVGATVVQVLGALATLAGTASLLALRPSVTGVVAVASAVTVGAGVALAAISRRLASGPLVFDRATARLIVRAAVPIGVSLIGVVVYRRADQLLLGAYGRITDLGQYAAAVRLVDALNIVPLAVTTLALPVLTRAQAEVGAAGPDGASGGPGAGRDLRMAAVGYRLLASVILPLAALGTYEGGWLMGVVFGHPYRAAGASLAVLLWAHFFGFTGPMVNQVLIARRLSRYMAALTVGGAAINLGANLWAIPAYGKLGAAYTSLVAYAFPAVAGALVPAVRDVFRSSLTSSVRPAAAAGALLGILELLRPSASIGFVVAVLVTGPLLLVTGAVRWSEVRDMVSSVLRRSGGGSGPAVAP